MMRLVTLAILISASMAYAQDPSGWVGKKVVTKVQTPLRIGNRIVHDGGVFRVYTVESVNGAFLWVTFRSVAGYVQADQVVPFDQAIDYYTPFTKTDRAAWAFGLRGIIWKLKGELDIAIADFSEAIRLDPNNAAFYTNRGWALLGKKEYDKAIADCNEAIRLDPKNAAAYTNRGWALFLTKEYDKAIADCNEAIRLDPKLAEAYTNRAWLWATCPDEKYRDGKRAFESASKAYELGDGKDPDSLGTLAATYAEAGDFAAAIEWQEKANRLYEDGDDKRKGEDRLKLYRQKKPYRE
jgi:tetratricopeptide (TPR) repeat protein